jgi:hypothetical protein
MDGQGFAMFLGSFSQGKCGEISSLFEDRIGFLILVRIRTRLAVSFVPFSGCPYHPQWAECFFPPMFFSASVRIIHLQLLGPWEIGLPCDARGPNEEFVFVLEMYVHADLCHAVRPLFGMYDFLYIFLIFFVKSIFKLSNVLNFFVKVR